MGACGPVLRLGGWAVRSTERARRSWSPGDRALGLGTVRMPGPSVANSSSSCLSSPVLAQRTLKEKSQKDLAHLWICFFSRLEVVLQHVPGVDLQHVVKALGLRLWNLLLQMWLLALRLGDDRVRLGLASCALETPGTQEDGTRWKK